MQPVEKIRKLLCNLPKSDQGLGEQFVQSRDFESLKELVDSVIYKVKKNLRSTVPKHEYTIIDLSELEELQAEVYIYLTYLELPSSNEDSLNLNGGFYD